MNKVDWIKIRVTPEYKARVQREAAYRQISVTELIERALEPLLAEQDDLSGMTAPRPSSTEIRAELPVATTFVPGEYVIPIVPVDAAPQEAVTTADEVGAREECGCPEWAYCPHGR